MMIKLDIDGNITYYGIEGGEEAPAFINASNCGLYKKVAGNFVVQQDKVDSLSRAMSEGAYQGALSSPIELTNPGLWQQKVSAQLGTYPQWAVATWVTRGMLVTHNDVVYNVVQSNQTQADWTPDITPALFRAMPVKYPGENYTRWRQPIDSEDAYKLDERVTHNGEDWKSNVDANVWQPPTQWTSLTVVAGYPPWAPWPGSGPTYQVGDRVTHNGSNWESVQADNVWEPGVFGWVMI